MKKRKVIAVIGSAVIVMGIAGYAVSNNFTSKAMGSLITTEEAKKEYEISTESPITAMKTRVDAVIDEKASEDDITGTVEVIEDTVAEVTEESVEKIVEEAASIYTAADYNMYATSSLNVREGMDANTAKVGSLAVNEEVRVIGEVADSEWVLISYADGEEGHVNRNYLSDTKVAVSTPKESSNTGTQEASTGSSGSSSGSSYDPLLEIIANGGDPTLDGTSTIGYIGDFVP